MRIILASLVVALVACGPSRDDRGTDAGSDMPCEGLACQVVPCERMGKPPTTISGTVFAPNGTLALYGANVYVPLVDPGPFAEGVSCQQCQDQLPGGAVANAMSDTAGKFSVV